MVTRRTFAALAAALAVASGACIEDRGTPPGVEQARAVDVNAAGVMAVTADERRIYTLDAGGDWEERGALPSAATEATAINDAGTVVGTASGPAEDPYATTAVISGPSGGVRPLFPVAAGPTTAADVNNDGMVVGTLRVAIGPVQTVSGYLHDPGTGATRLLGPPTDHIGALPVAINDAGQVVGRTLYPGYAYLAGVLWEPPHYDPVMLPTLPGDDIRSQPSPTAIDDDGTIVGTYRTDEPPFVHGIVWSAGDHTPTRLANFLPEDIDGGDMVGTTGDTLGANAEDNPEAAWWGAGEDTFQRLGVLAGGESAAVAVEDEVIVGHATVGPDGPRHVATFAPSRPPEPGDGAAPAA